MSSHPNNEPILGYEPGSAEKETLLKEINKQMEEVIEIPCIINGEKIYTNNCICKKHSPFDTIIPVVLKSREPQSALDQRYTKPFFCH